MSEAETPPARILVLDDEEPLRRMLQEILGMKGYACDTASTGEDAVTLWSRESSGPTPFRLALIDLTLGDGPGGLDFAARIRKSDPTAILIACSGDSTDPVMVEPARYGFDGTLTKPFLFGTLLETLAAVLGRTANDVSAIGLPWDADHAKLFRLGESP
jgi:DNA-binding response OmpR family regulator